MNGALRHAWPDPLAPRVSFRFFPIIAFLGVSFSACRDQCRRRAAFR